MNLSPVVPILPLARYRFCWNCRDHVKLPDYAGSTWRGAFGHSLKKLVCATHEPVCKQCLLYRNCSYPYIFETPPDPKHGVMTKYNAIPHPFVLIPGSNMSGQLAAGTDCELELVLFGRANRQLAYFIQALTTAAQHGLGKERGRLELNRVEQQLANGQWTKIYQPQAELTADTETEIEIPPCPSRCQIKLQTPLRLKQNDHNVTPQRFTFKVLFSNLMRRISMLTVFHTDTPLEADFTALAQAADEITVENPQLFWKEWARYSSRQNTLLQMGGLTGDFELDGKEIAPFWPYLWLGQWTNAGKGTSMGLGKYEITSNT